MAQARVAQGDPIMGDDAITAAITTWSVGSAIEIGWSSPGQLSGHLTRGLVVSKAANHTWCTVDLGVLGVQRFPDTVSVGWQCHSLRQEAVADIWGSAMRESAGGKSLTEFDPFDVLSYSLYLEAVDIRQRAKDLEYLSSILRSTYGLTRDSAPNARQRDGVHTQVNSLLLALTAWCKASQENPGTWRGDANVCVGDHINACLGAYKVTMCGGSIKKYHDYLAAEPGIRGRVSGAVRRGLSTGNDKDGK